MIPAEINKNVCEVLCKIHGQEVIIRGESTIGGGCINNALKLETNVSTYFLKWNSASSFPGMFSSEARGLNLLRNSSTLYIPEVISANESEEHSYLMLEYIDSATMSKSYWEHFGKSLAELHKVSTDQFGLDHDNYIGSLRQSNQQHSTWKDFFINERLMPQLKLASLEAGLTQKFENLYGKLDEIFPNEPPALLHGDLWSGNYMVSKTGAPVTMDAAVYYGHRETDLAMSKLFGGFDSRFYSAYNEAFRLEQGWQERFDICNLYPLLVHVNLFGGSYLNQVRSTLEKF
ncbi:MAG: ketosamine-3-kinase [Bacteroidetes bacterium]|nr:MAG: ketosamine-3-kinase [Bacteroidota bacterium]